MTDKFIGTRIKAARRARGLSQGKLADKLGISRSAVSQWEAGDTTPSSENVRQMALELDATLEWLSTGRGSPNFGKVSDSVVSPPPFSTDDPAMRTAVACEYMATQIYHIRQTLDRIAQAIDAANHRKS